jgi:hypothetical protein
MKKPETPIGTLENGILLAQLVLTLLTDETLPDASTVIGENVLDLPNSERFDAWFTGHPDFEGTKAIFQLVNGKNPAIEGKLYWLKKKSSSIVAGSVHFTPNWEDAEWSRNSNYKLGIDFFLSPNGTSLYIVLSNMGKIRILELTERLTNTDIEVLKNWTKIPVGSDMAVIHGCIWSSFQLQSVNAKFYNGVADLFQELQKHLVAFGKPDLDAKMFSSRILGRLIFIWFLRKMGLISEAEDYFSPSGIEQNIYYREKLEKLFFGVLNKPMEQRSSDIYSDLDSKTPYLNGGLFSPKLDDWEGELLSFPPEFFTRTFKHFEEFNFTTDESTPEYEQVAIDPEMLGRVFESLLATQIEATGELARKAKGAFYTPREIVSYMCKEAVRDYLHGFDDRHSKMRESVDLLLDKPDQEWAIAGTNSLRDIPKEVRTLILEALSNIKSIDPACGSGAFPLGLLSLLASLHQRLLPSQDMYKTKLSILQSNIFGSDIEPMAIEISRLRSWLSLIVEIPPGEAPDPLPNLDFNFVCANSLKLLQVADLFTDFEVEIKLASLRKDYFFESSPAGKAKIHDEYFHLTASDSDDIRNNQLKTFNPFDSEKVAEFFDSEVMFGLPSGFDIVLGNPPYVDSELMAKILPEFRNYVKANYSTARGNWDLFIPFSERAIRLAKPGGVISFIVKNSLMDAPYAEEFRKFLSSLQIMELREFGGIKVFESAAVDTCIFRVKNQSVVWPQAIVTRMATSEAAAFSRSVNISELHTSSNWIPIFATDLSREILLKLSVCDPIDKRGFSAKSAAIVSEAYQIAEVIYENPKPGSQEFRLINTGTIDPFVNLWGVKETTYLKKKYMHPVVSLKDIENINSTRAEQASMPKIITIGMGNIEAYLDENGAYIPGKTTNIIFPTDTLDLVQLKVLVCLLNSRVGRFWFKQNFLSAGMGGISPSNLLTMPYPTFTDEQIELLVSLFDELSRTVTSESIDRLDEIIEDAFLLSEVHRAELARLMVQ